MPESIWDLVGKLMYILGLLGVVPEADIKDALNHLEKEFQRALKGPLWALVLHEPTGGRDHDDTVCVGVFTSRHGAVMHLLHALEGAAWFTEEARQEIVNSSGLSRFRPADFEDNSDVTYTIMPVLDGLDPKP